MFGVPARGQVLPNVHGSQRAKVGSYKVLVEAAATFGSNALGTLVGERVISTHLARGLPAASVQSSEHRAHQAHGVACA